MTPDESSRDEPELRTAEDVLALARARGLPVEPDDAEAIQPLLESLLARLAALSAALPADSSPQPTGGERFPR
jgi:hypothetical protein